MIAFALTDIVSTYLRTWAESRYHIQYSINMKIISIDLYAVYKLV